jgi:uncharacterized protein
MGKFKMVHFDKIHTNVMDRLNKKLPICYTYHDAEHTQYVLDKAILIAEAENVSPDDMVLVKTAALYHDIGYLIGRINHEELSCQAAIQELENFKYSDESIKKVCGMIAATKIPQNPQNLLDQIIADADLEYLGTDLFELGGRKLYSELKCFNPSLSADEWIKIQISFLESHKYHTKFCIENREPKKQENLNKLKMELNGR